LRSSFGAAAAAPRKDARPASEPGETTAVTNAGFETKTASDMPVMPDPFGDTSDTSADDQSVALDTSPTGEPVRPGNLAPPVNGTSVPAPDDAALVHDRAPAKLVISTAPDSLPPPKETQEAGPAPACPQCESPMAWVEEHLRFYCKSCRMYF